MELGLHASQRFDIMVWAVQLALGRVWQIVGICPLRPLIPNMRKQVRRTGD